MWRWGSTTSLLALQVKKKKDTLAAQGSFLKPAYIKVPANEHLKREPFGQVVFLRLEIYCPVWLHSHQPLVSLNWALSTNSYFPRAASKTQKQVQDSSLLMHRQNNGNTSTHQWLPQKHVKVFNYKWLIILWQNSPKMLTVWSDALLKLFIFLICWPCSTTFTEPF